MLRFDNPVVIATYLDHSVQKTVIIWLGELKIFVMTFFV